MSRIPAAALVAVLVTTLAVDPTAAPAAAAPPPDFSGTIWIEDDRTPAGAGEVTITLDRPFAPFEHREAATDANGRYEIADLPNAGYWVVLHDTLGRYPDLRWYYPSGGGVVWNWTFGADGFLSGVMRASDGRTLPGSVVLYRHDPDGTTRIMRQGIGADAVFEYSRLPLSPDFTWDLQFEPDDPAYPEEWWTPGGSAATPTRFGPSALTDGTDFSGSLPVASTFEGRVTFAGTGEPRTGSVSIEVEIQHHGVWTPLVSPYNVTDGFRLTRISPGTYRFRVVWVRGGATSIAYSDPISIAPGAAGAADVEVPRPILSRDTSADGTADLLVVDEWGRLLRYAGRASSVPNYRWEGLASEPRVIGTGWRKMTAVLQAGDLTGDGWTDVVARDAAGNLLLYAGTSLGSLSRPTRIAKGFGGFTAIVAPGDFTGDGAADLIVRDSAGRLYLYPGNGRGGLSARRLIGSGWNSMTAIVGPGDFNGDGRVDLLARDKRGVLWLYPGTGTSLGVRSVVGTGFQNMTAIFSLGDFSGDGLPDVMVRARSGLLFYFFNQAGSGLGLATEITLDMSHVRLVV